MILFGKVLQRIYKISGSKYYLEVLPQFFFTSWFFQKVLGNNRDVPHPVHFTTLVSGYKNIIFDRNNKATLLSFAVSGGCYFGIANGSTLEIGEDTIWAWNFNIQTGNHGFIDRNEYEIKSIKIGKNCWIGGNVTILPGVQLGDNITIGANSVVTKSFPSNVVIAGVPAKVIKELN